MLKHNFFACSRMQMINFQSVQCNAHFMVQTAHIEIWRCTLEFLREGRRQWAIHELGRHLHVIFAVEK